MVCMYKSVKFSNDQIEVLKKLLSSAQNVLDDNGYPYEFIGYIRNGLQHLIEDKSAILFKD